MKPDDRRALIWYLVGFGLFMFTRIQPAGRGNLLIASFFVGSRKGRRCLIAHSAPKNTDEE